MTRQPNREPRSHSTTAGFRLHADVGGGGDTYATFRGFRYFILFVCEATGYVWVRFLKKKSEALLAFQNLVTLLERQFGIRVCILHADFGEFNSEAAATYFEESGIIWESSVNSKTGLLKDFCGQSWKEPEHKLSIPVSL